MMNRKFPFNLIDECESINKNTIGRSVRNKVIFQNDDFIVMVIIGPNNRSDYHINPKQEFFYQIKGTLELKILKNSCIETIEINEGCCFSLTENIPHRPVRGENSIGIVVESARRGGQKVSELFRKISASQLGCQATNLYLEFIIALENRPSRAALSSGQNKKNYNLMYDSVYTEKEVKAPNLNEIFGYSDRYVYTKVLGQGAYGIVCAAKDKYSCSDVAIKRIDQISSVLVARRTLRELKLLRHFKDHSNIISIIDVYEKGNNEINELYITQELMDTDMYQLIQSKHQFTDNHIQAFMYQILRGLKAIHSANVLHRDLKPGNLLWKNTGEIKICDFGLARGLNEPVEGNEISLTNYVATRWYRPPEILLYKANYGKSLDMWSIGCIFAEFLGRKVFLPGQSGFEQLQLILQKIGTPDDDVIDRIPSEKSRAYLRRLPRYSKISLYRRFPDANPLAIDLLEKMMQFEPSARISAADALKHPYLARFHDPNREVNYPVFDFSFDAKCITLQDLKRAILDEIGLHQLSQRIPATLDPKGYIGFDNNLSRDPTLIAPKNYLQADDINYSNSQSNDQILRERSNHSMDKIGIPQATRSIYQALKRGLRRLSIRRNNSA